MCQYWACCWAKKRTNFFFVQSQFYRCADFHATYKLAPAGPLRFAPSLAINMGGRHKAEPQRYPMPLQILAFAPLRIHHLKWLENSERSEKTVFRLPWQPSLIRPGCHSKRIWKLWKLWKWFSSFLKIDYFIFQNFSSNFALYNYSNLFQSIFLR